MMKEFLTIPEIMEHYKDDLKILNWDGNHIMEFYSGNLLEGKSTISLSELVISGDSIQNLINYALKRIKYGIN